MVKHPQSHLGYAVDGCVTFPARKTIPEESRVLGQTLLGKKKKKAASRRFNSCAKKPSAISENSVRALYKELRFTSELVDLKNASKQGKIHEAERMLWIIVDRYFRCKSSSQYVLSLARCLIVPDIESRSAVYYAAHAGHVTLVKTYLALLVFARSIRRPGRAACAADCRKSIQNWLHYLGYFYAFGQDELDLCFMSALNEKVESLFKHETYTLFEIRSIIMQSWSESIPHNLRSKIHAPRKKSKPRLNVEDAGFVGTHNAKIPQVELDYHQDYYDDNDFQDDEDSSAPDMVGEVDDLVLQSTFNDDDEEIIMQLYYQSILEESHYDNDDDDWSEVNSDADDTFVDVSGNGLTDHCDNDHDWSVVSGYSSVKSYCSGPMSYKDVLKFGSRVPETVAMKIIEDEIPGRYKSKSDEKPTLALSTGDSTKNAESGISDDDTFDNFFLWEGEKGSRGGKKQFMFKGNQKTPWRSCR